MAKKSSLQRRMAKLSFDLTKRSRFYRDMASFVSEGIPPADAMRDMLKVASRRRGLSYLATILSDVLKGLEGGRASIGEALTEWVPGAESSMITAGEASGRLVDAFRELAWNTSEQARVWASVKAQFILICVLILASLALMYYVLAMAVPEATKMLKPEMVSKLIVAPYYIDIGEFIVGNVVVLGLAILAMGTAAFVSLPRWVGKRRTSLSKWLPPWSLYSWTQASFFLSAVSSMLSAGVTFRQAIEMILPAASPWQRWHLRRMRSALMSGKSEVESMDTGMLPDPVMDQILIYARIPSFPAVMAAASRDSIRMYEEKVTSIAKTVELIVIIALSGFIITTMLSIGEIALAVEEMARRMGSAQGI